MNVDFNPYRPGAGAVPEYLAGRADIIKQAVKSLQMVKVSYPARPIIYYGLRGVGKTVLLDTVENHALDLDIPCKYIEIKENEKYKFLKQLALCTYQLSLKLSSLNKISSYAKRTLGIIKAFSVKYGDIGFSVDIEPEIGSADTGDLDNDITELLLSVGYLAKKENKGAVLLIDEIQYIKTDEFESFMTAIHRLNQKSYPIAIFGAGMPKIVKIAGDVKSYAERLFNFQEIGSLDDEAAILALTEPLKRFNVSYEKDALCKILEVTQGYPYFLQEYGSCIWDMKEDESDISLKDVDNAYDDFIKQGM